jgi:sigma-E factor negative regulatory protein RseA
MNPRHTSHEQISALADGQLEGDEFALCVANVCADDELRATWRTYHLVGEVLRAGTRNPCTDTSVFLAKLRQNLAAEEPQPMIMSPRPAPLQRRVEAANQPVFRWKLVAGAASLAAVAAIGWNLIGGVEPRPAGPQLAQQGGSVLAAASGGPADQGAMAGAPMRVVVGGNNAQGMLRDPRLDQLLEAHRQAGGASQMPSGFLRNATFEGVSR